VINSSNAFARSLDALHSLAYKKEKDADSAKYFNNRYAVYSFLIEDLRKAHDRYQVALRKYISTNTHHDRSYKYNYAEALKQWTELDSVTVHAISNKPFYFDFRFTLFQDTTYVQTISGIKANETIRWNDNYLLAFNYTRYLQHLTFSSRQTQLLRLLDKLNKVFIGNDSWTIYSDKYDLNGITLAELSSGIKYILLFKVQLDDYFAGTYSNNIRLGE
jgi:hypothetical protein